jgi:uncharacterized membrane protein YjgN (DUF898 family)
LKDAYRTQWPVLLPLFLILGLGAFMSLGTDSAGKPQWSFGWIAVALLPLLSVIGSVYSFWAVKKYQHSHYALGELQTRFSAGVGQFAKLFLKLIGMMLLISFALGIIAAVGIPLMGAKMPRGFGMVIFGAVVYLLLLAALLSTFRPWFIARSQNLIWNHTGNDELQFHSALKARSLIGLAFKNWLLIIVTLGFYWPFAAIATTRMRLEAVYADLTTSADQLTGSAAGAAVGASGEAAGDLFGLDVGL